MVTIRAAKTVDMDLLKHLIAGYTSQEKYEITRYYEGETLSFQLQLHTLPTPYIKQFELEDEAYYQKIISAGLSLVVYDEGKPIALGLADYQAWNRSFWIHEFHVLNHYHKQSIGRELMTALVEKAGSVRARIIVLETQNTNIPAIRFYRKMGFAIEGIDLSFYTNDDVDNGEVAIFMKRRLSKALNGS